MRVSVVIPSFNAARFLREAIDSVHRQTFRALELIVVDDGSTDATADIAHSMGATIISNGENLGVSAARNRGIAKAHGEYIAFLDADDVWLPEKLEIQVAALDAHPEVGMVYASTLNWHSWTKNPKRPDRIVDLRIAANVPHPPPTLLSTYLNDGSITPCTCSTLLRREIAELGFEPEFRDLYEDQVFYVKACLATHIMRLEQCVAKYRQHKDSVCAKGDHTAARRKFLDWVSAYCAESPSKWS